EPAESGPVLKVRVDSPRIAKNLRLELYRLRSKSQKISRRGLSPDDPRYGSSPWDSFKLVIPEGSSEIHFYKEDVSPHTYQIIPQEVLELSKPKRKPRKKALPDS